MNLTLRASWLAAGKTLGFLCSIALPLVLTRRLEVNDFGAYKQLVTLLGTMGMILPFGVQMSGHYFLPRLDKKEEKAQIAWIIVLFHLISTSLVAVAIGVWPQSLRLILGPTQLVADHLLVAVLGIVWVVGALLEYIAVPHGDVRFASVYILASNVFRSACILAAAIVWRSFHAIAVAALVSSIAQTLSTFWYVQSRFPEFRGRIHWPLARTLLGYALPLGAAGMLYTLSIDLHNYMVSAYFGTAMFAVYAIGCFDLPLVAIIGESTASVMIPRVSELQKQGRREEIIGVAARATRGVAAVYLPLFAFLFVMAGDFIVTVFTKRYAASAPIFRVNLLSLPISMFIMDPLIRAYFECRYFYLKLYVWTVAILTVALYFGMRRYGMIGAISIVIAVLFVGRVATFLRVVRLLELRWADLRQIADVGKLAIASLAGGAAAYLTRWAILPWPTL